MEFKIYSDEQVEYGFGRQTVFGTPLADSFAFKKLLVPKDVFIDLAIKNSNLNMNRSSRLLDLADIHVDEVSGPVTLTIPEMIMTLDDITGIIPYCTQLMIAKQIFMHDSQPDFLANEGFFFTLAFKNKAKVGSDIKVSDCVISKMTIDWDKTGDGEKRIVKFKNVTILGRVFNNTSNFTGIWTSPDLTKTLYSHVFTLKENDSEVVWKSASLTIDNGIVPLNKDLNGNFLTYAMHPPELGAVVFEYTTWFNSQTTSLDYIAKQKAKEPMDIEMEGGNMVMLTSGIIDGNPQGAEDKELICKVKLICGAKGTKKILDIEDTGL